ncbi:MAG TPA: TrbI/VirB10 family protein [Candidatus Angelobacter sp.]
MPDEIKNEKTDQPAVTDKRTDPPGVMRKSIQSWVILAIAVLMLLLIWLTGGTKAKSTTPESKPSPASANTTGGAPEDIARRLLAQQQEQARSLLAHANGPNLPNANLAGQQRPPFPDQQMPQGQQMAQAPPVDPIVEDQRKRKYTSLFSSNIALSYREPQTKTTTQAPQQPTPEQLAAAIAGLPIASYPTATPANFEPPATTGSIPNPQQPSPPLAAANADHHNVPANLNQASGKDYTVFEGTFLETVLVTRLDGDFSGPVICMLANDIYSQDRQHLLIPSGSKLLGETKHVDGFGQRRLAISFHRLIMPDGYSLDLDRFQGLNQIGETGLKDKINNHYLQIFGASIAIGAIAGLAEAGTSTNAAGVQSSADVYRQGIASSLSQSSLHVLDRFLNILPTITIREGHRVKVYLTQDLLVPDYTRHEMPANL